MDACPLLVVTLVGKTISAFVISQSAICESPNIPKNRSNSEILFEYIYFTQIKAFGLLANPVIPSIFHRKWLDFSSLHLAGQWSV